MVGIAPSAHVCRASGGGLMRHVAKSTAPGGRRGLTERQIVVLERIARGVIATVMAQRQRPAPPPHKPRRSRRKRRAA